MTAVEAILRRRSNVRLDPDRPVPDAMLVQLLSLAGRAPSPHNLQPWRFLVVRDRANRDRLRRACFQHPRLDEAPVVILVLGYHNSHRTHWPTILERMKERAGLAPEDVGRISAEVRRDLAAEPDLGFWACRHATAASTILMITAQELGLAAVPIDRFQSDPIREVFGIPLDHTLCGVIALGFASGNAPDLGCLPLGELCYEEHFGQPWTLGEQDDLD